MKEDICHSQEHIEAKVCLELYMFKPGYYVILVRAHSFEKKDYGCCYIVVVCLSSSPLLSFFFSFHPSKSTCGAKGVAAAQGCLLCFTVYVLW